MTEQRRRGVILCFFGGSQHVMITSADAKGKSEKIDNIGKNVV